MTAALAPHRRAAVGRPSILAIVELAVLAFFHGAASPFVLVCIRSPRREGQLDHATRRVNTVSTMPVQISLMVRPDGRSCYAAQARIAASNGVGTSCTRRVRGILAFSSSSAFNSASASAALR
jgi:hypothetical protein